MKLLLLFGLLLVAGLCLAESTGTSEESNSKDTSEDTTKARVRRSLPEFQPETYFHMRSLKRTVRSTGLGDNMALLEATLISHCKANGHTAVASKLEDTYDDMKVCLKRKQLFVTPRDEYIRHLEDCTKDAVQQTKVCLSEDQKYFPDFVLDVGKSLVNLFYDDRQIMATDLARCTPNFSGYRAQRNYIQCLTDVTVQGSSSSSSSSIPLSKAAFCQKFIPAATCFSDMIRDSCNETPKLAQFRRDYVNAIKVPCEKKEVNSVY